MIYLKSYHQYDPYKLINGKVPFKSVALALDDYINLPDCRRFTVFTLHYFLDNYNYEKPLLVDASKEALTRFLQ